MFRRVNIPDIFCDARGKDAPARPRRRIIINTAGGRTLMEYRITEAINWIPATRDLQPVELVAPRNHRRRILPKCLPRVVWTVPVFEVGGFVQVCVLARTLVGAQQHNPFILARDTCDVGLGEIFASLTRNRCACRPGCAVLGRRNPLDGVARAIIVAVTDPAISIVPTDGGWVWLQRVHPRAGDVR